MGCSRPAKASLWLHHPLTDRSNSSSTGFRLAEENAGPSPAEESAFAANPFLEWPVPLIGPPLVYTLVTPQSFLPSLAE